MFNAWINASSASGSPGNGILVITGSPIHHWITPALVGDVALMTYHGSGTKMIFTAILSFDLLTQVGNAVNGNHSQISMFRSLISRQGLRLTAALDWWWYSGSCQGSPKVFVPVQKLSTAMLQSDFQYKWDWKHPTEILQSIHPLHWITPQLIQPFQLVLATTPAAFPHIFFAAASVIQLLAARRMRMVQVEAWRPRGVGIFLLQPNQKMGCKWKKTSILGEFWRLDLSDLYRSDSLSMSSYVCPGSVSLPVTHPQMSSYFPQESLRYHGKRVYTATLT